MPVRKVKKALHAAVLSDETVTSQPGSLNHRDWKVVARRFGESLIFVLGAPLVLSYLEKMRVPPETWAGLFFALFVTVCQWCRYRRAMPPSQRPDPPSLPPMEGEAPDFTHSHYRHDLKVTKGPEDTDEFFMRQAK